MLSPRDSHQNTQPVMGDSNQAQSRVGSWVWVALCICRVSGRTRGGNSFQGVARLRMCLPAHPPISIHTPHSPPIHAALSIPSQAFLPVPLLTICLPHPVALAGLWRPCWTHSVLQPVPASSEVHVSGVSVVEAAFAELASEADNLPLVTAYLGQNTAQLPAGQP